MVSSNAVVLCTYSYDPLDRLAGASPGGSDSVQRFYQKSRLTTEIQGQIQRAVFQSEDHLLARQQLQSGQTGCALLGTDQQRSVLHSLDPAQQRAFAYSPYGFRPPQLDLPGFNGEQPDPVTGHYLLGNGYRAFNPILMRFNSPDSLSPFGDGGLNAYAYCVGDPVNRVDPTGHTPAFLKVVLRAARLMKRSTRTALSSTRLIKRVKPDALKSLAEAVPQRMPRLTAGQIKSTRAQLGRNKDELKVLDSWIKKDVAQFGPETMDRNLDPVFYDMFFDSVTRRDNLLDENVFLGMKLGELPEYNYASGLPRYTDVVGIRKSQ